MNQIQDLNEFSTYNDYDKFGNYTQWVDINSDGIQNESEINCKAENASFKDKASFFLKHLFD